MQFALTCDEESSELSNSHELEIWQALESLTEILQTGSQLPQNELLLSWKSSHHHTTAREAYGWRAVIEEIKNSDLPTRCAKEKQDPKYTLMIDKPAMLKIAGEITNALLHSYTRGHRVSFQNVSKEPSGFAL
jgi:hypothetical protein